MSHHLLKSTQPQQPPAHEAADRTQLEAGCRKTYEAAKDYINNRMRQGYTAQEGEYLREMLRQIEQSYRACVAAIS